MIDPKKIIADSLGPLVAEANSSPYCYDEADAMSEAEHIVERLKQAGFLLRRLADQEA